MCKLYYSLIAVVPAMMLASCDKKSAEAPGPQSETVTVEAILPAGHMWNPGDKAGFYDAGGKLLNASAELGQGAGSSNGLFSIEAPSGISEVYAYAPYSAGGGTDVSAVSAGIPSTIEYDMLEPPVPYAFFAGKGECSGEKVSIGLAVLTGRLSLDLSSDGYFSGEVTSVSVDMEGGTGMFSVDLLADKPELVHAGGEGGVTVNVCNMSLGTDGDGLPLCFSVSPGEYEGATITVSTSAGNTVLENVSFTVCAGEETHVPVKVTDPSVEIIDLNSDGKYANCYIADNPGAVYRFDAKVMGTGVATSGIPEPEAINPEDVFVLWETGSVPGSVIRSVDLSTEGIVSFVLADEADGNAVIAVTDGRPVEGDWPRSRGTILWSWHIWAASGVADVQCTGFSGNKYTMMDRNLGEWTQASGETEYQGLKYQWGRKDPFIGFTSSGTVFENAVSVTEQDYVQVPGSVTDFSSDEATLWESVSYPEVFFGATYATSYDWYGTGYDQSNRNDALWGYQPDGSYVKTMLDPCPEGYMVAPADAYSGFTKTGATAFSVDDFSVEGDFADGWYFTNAGSFFPASGSMAYNNGVLRMIPSYNGREGYYWSSTPDGENSRMVDFTASYVFMNSNKRASGCSVRCVRTSAL